MLDAGVQTFGVLANDDQIDAGVARGTAGRLRIGRKLANSSNCLRSATLMLEKPPPIGVVTGPFRPMWVRSMDSVSSFGMYS